MKNTIRIGHSPDPDDAFMFYGFASGQVSIPGHEIVHVLQDIQSLNEQAAGPDPLEVTAISVHAFLGLGARYRFLEVGTSVGRGYGPKLVALEPKPVDALAGARIALPGPKTTATLVARGLLPPFEEVHRDFTEIMAAVTNREVDAGVLIHEGQLTYADQGLVLLGDFGQMFAERHEGLPLPLGVNCIRSDLPSELQKVVADAYRRSVEIALTQRKDAVDYALQFGRGLDRDLADRFVGMYVNEDSLSFHDELFMCCAANTGTASLRRPDEGVSIMSQRDRVIVVCRSSECFADEVAYAAAASHWPRSFWKALDRLFAGGVLMNCPADFQWEGN